MRDNISPEEKLLRLIRGTKNKEAAVSPQAQNKETGKPASGHRKPGVNIFINFRNRISLNRVVWSVFILAVIYLVFSLSYPLLGLGKINGKVNLPQAAIGQTAFKQEAKPLDYYVEGVKNRYIFGANPGVASTEVASADLVKDINLVGIIAGDIPQAIIEDKKSQKTYYLNKGQSFGEFQVTDIQESKIILNYRGQNYELHL